MFLAFCSNVSYLMISQCYWMTWSSLKNVLDNIRLFFYVRYVNVLSYGINYFFNAFTVNFAWFGLYKSIMELNISSFYILVQFKLMYLDSFNYYRDRYLSYYSSTLISKLMV